MTLHPIRALSVALIVLASAACSGGSPSASASPSPTAATTFGEFGVAYCEAWDALFIAVGNPDTGSGSQLSKALDDAIVARDAATADRVAATMTAQLEAGRRQLAIAAGWKPAAPMLAQFDRFFVAYEAMIATKRQGGDPQKAFEKAGGVDAWHALFEVGRQMQRPPDASPGHCATVPVSY
jgi:hypothetical protein